MKAGLNTVMAIITTSVMKQISNNILLGGPINLFGTIQFTCNSNYLYTHTYTYIPINNLILWNIAIFLNNWILK